jgi:hypothetical protein
MAHGTKFRTEFKDYFNRDITVLFKFKDYSGDITDIYTAEGSGDIYQPENETNIFNPIRGSEFRIDLISQTDSQLIDLFVNNKRDCLVQVYRESSLFWQGWLIPNQYSERYDAAPYPVTVTARDGLAELKTYTFDRDGFFKPASLFGIVLNKLDFGANMCESVNIYESSYMDNDLTDSMLTQCLYDSENYKGMSYYDVLRDMLTGLGAEIQQVNGKWKVTRIAELNADLEKREMTISLPETVISHETENHVRLIGRPQNRDFANNDAEIIASPGWNSFEMKRDAGRRFGFLNHDFSGEYFPITTGYLAEHWNHYPGTVLRKWRSGNKFVQKSETFNINAGSTQWGIYQSVVGANPAMIFTQKYFLRVSVAITKKPEYEGDTVLCGLKTQLKVTDGVNTYWLSGLASAFVNTPAYIEFKNISASDDSRLSFVNYELIFSPPPISGELTLDVFCPYPNNSGDMVKVSGWYINDATLDIYHELFGEYNENGLSQQFATTKVSVNQNMSYIPDIEVDFKFSDYPIIPNRKIIYRNGIIRSVGDITPTELWTARGGDISVPLQTHLVLNYISHYNINRWILRGTILSQDVYFDNAIVDYQVNSRVYYCKGGTYNLRRAMLTGIFHEIGAWSGAPWILEDGTWNDNGIWIDGEVWNDGE